MYIAIRRPSRDVESSFKSSLYIMYICACVRARACVCMCVLVVYTHTHTHTHIYIYIYIYIYKRFGCIMLNSLGYSIFEMYSVYLLKAVNKMEKM